MHEVAKAMPERYVDAYQDYIPSKEANMESITLSSFSLKDVAVILKPLDRLAAALMNSIHDEGKRRVVIDARANSRGFVAGLYTDLYDFCWELRSNLSSHNIHDAELVASSRAICDAMDFSGDNPFVFAIQSPHDKHCHGISIYFP